MKTKPQSIHWLALAALAICHSPLFNASAQDVSFTNNVYLFSSYPVCVVAADFTGRGKPDLVAAIGNSFDVLDVLTNKGDGTFAFATAYFTGGSPLCLATADVNGNGQADLICGVSPNLLVLTNNGHGVFGTNGIYYAGNGPQSVAVADVNGDGSQDLIAANYNDNTVTVLTNSGGGIFFSNATYGVGSGPSAVVAADINGDGAPDLVVADYADSMLMVLTNNGSGVFGTNKIYDLPSGAYLPTTMVVADVNGDGKPDLIVASRSGALTVLTNNGHGTFGFNAIYSVGYDGVSVVATNIHGYGGVPDLITANYDDNTLTVLTNNGAGVFATNVIVTNEIYSLTTPQGIVAADVNGDSLPDLIVVNINAVTVFINTTPGPGLNIAPAGNNINLSWSPAATNYTLQYTTNLVVPNWRIATNGTPISGGFQVTNIVPAMYFRLLKQ